MPNLNSQTKGKSSMYIKKNFDSDIPSNIMTSISMWIDCYNSNISEKTKIRGHYEFENRINDTEFATSSLKMSTSAKKSENEKFQHEKNIFTWLSLQEDKDIDYFSTKISKLMSIDKAVIISSHVNQYRLNNNKKSYNPDYKKPFIKQAPTPFIKSSSLVSPSQGGYLRASDVNQSASKPAPSKIQIDIHKSVPEIPKVVEKVYKDAWDDHFS
jgi:hypothetical protein